MFDKLCKCDLLYMFQLYQHQLVLGRIIGFYCSKLLQICNSCQVMKSYIFLDMFFNQQIIKSYLLVIFSGDIRECAVDSQNHE